MNSNYSEFKFPQIKAHPWHKVRVLSASGGIKVQNQNMIAPMFLPFYIIRISVLQLWLSITNTVSKQKFSHPAKVEGN
jgi:hypothetical protein